MHGPVKPPTTGAQAGCPPCAAGCPHGGPSLLLLPIQQLHSLASSGTLSYWTRSKSSLFIRQKAEGYSNKRLSTGRPAGLCRKGLVPVRGEAESTGGVGCPVSSNPHHHPPLRPTHQRTLVALIPDLLATHSPGLGLPALHVLNPAPGGGGGGHTGTQAEPPPMLAARETTVTAHAWIWLKAPPPTCGPTLENPDPYCGHRPPSAPLPPTPGQTQGLGPGVAGNSGQGRRTPETGPEHCSQHT